MLNYICYIVLKELQLRQKRKKTIACKEIVFSSFILTALSLLGSPGGSLGLSLLHIAKGRIPQPGHHLNQRPV